MRITYVPTFRGAQWVRRHRGSTTEGESATRPMNFRSQSAAKTSSFYLTC